MKFRLPNYIKVPLFLSVGLIILYLVFQRQDAAYTEECALKGIPAADCSLLGKILEDFANANYFWIALVLLVFTISNVSRALRWKMLLKPMGYVPRTINAFLTIALAYFANLGLPRVGEVIRAGTLAQYEHIPVEKVMGTVVLDRIVDVICMLIVTALALVLEYDRIWLFVEEHVNLSERIGGGGRLALYAALLGGLLLGLALLLQRRIRRSAFFERVSGILQGFWEGLQSIRRLENVGLFLLHTVIIWTMYFLVAYLCFFAYEPTSELSWLAGLTVFVFGGWGIVIPSPGGMGTYHFMVQTALVLYGVDSNDAFSYANIAFFSVQLGCNVLLGIVALVVLPIINRGYEPAPLITDNSIRYADSSAS